MKRVICIATTIVIIAFLTVLALQLASVIDNRFSSNTLSAFDIISELSLYILVGILVVNVIVSYMVKKYSNISSNVTICLVYILLGTTIISVNTVIWVWTMTLGLTIILLLFQIDDIISSLKKSK